MTTDPAVDDYLAGIDAERRGDVETLHALIRETLPHLEPHMSSGMIGYGTYHYRYDSGREGDAAVLALANNKRYISLYVMAADDASYLAESYRERLPKADIGRSCVRITRVADVDMDVVGELVANGARYKPS